MIHNMTDLAKYVGAAKATTVGIRDVLPVGVDFGHFASTVDGYSAYVWVCGGECGPTYSLTFPFEGGQLDFEVESALMDFENSVFND